MENNRYALHKQDIKRISEELNVDIGTACAMLRVHMCWTFHETKGVDKELTAFTRFVNNMDPDEVVAYFAE